MLSINLSKIVFLGAFALLFIACGETSNKKPIKEKATALQNLEPGTTEYLFGEQFCDAIGAKDYNISTMNGDIQHFNVVNTVCDDTVTARYSMIRTYNHPNASYDLERCGTYGSFINCTNSYSDGFISSYWGGDQEVVKQYCSLVNSDASFSNEQIIGDFTYRAVFQRPADDLTTFYYEKIDVTDENAFVTEKIAITLFQKLGGADLSKNGHIKNLRIDSKCPGVSGFNSSQYYRQN